MAVNQATGYNRTTNEPLDALFLNSGSVYASTTEVNSKVNITVRYTGSMFNVNGELYWYKDGVQDSDLVLFRVASASYAATASGADNFVVRNDFTASGLNYPSVDNGEESFIQTDGNGNLTLQYVKTIYEEVYNGEATTLVKGTPVYVSGSVGAASKVYRADAGNASKMPVVYVIPDNLAPGQVGKGIALGLIKGIDTTGYPAGTEIYLAVGGGWTSTRPTGSAVIQVLGYVTKEGNGGQGVVLNPGPASLPNVAFGNVWVGNENGYPTAQSTSSLHVDSASYAQNTTSAATASSADQFTVRVLNNAITDTDKFVVSDGGILKYRTGAEVLSDINAQPSGSYITSLTGEVTASGPGAASATLLNSAVTGKVLTGLNITGGTILATDTILQAFGKAQNQITGLMGGATYQGVWNASTNSPTITSSTGTKGHYYVVNVAGSTNIDGIIDWKVGDWIIFNGTNWDKVDNTDAVSSVNGFVGAVSLTTANIPEVTNLYYTDARARSAISSSATGLSYSNSTGVFTLTSGYVIPTTTQETNWTLAYTQTRQWDGGATGLNAATGRTSLGLGSMALENTGSYYTQTQINNFFAGTTAITGYNKSNWDNVYTWYSNNPLSGYLPLTAGASFPLTGTLHSSGVVTVLTAQSGNTSRRNIFLSNLSGDLTVGIEGSSGGATFSGSSAYAALFGTGVNQPIEIFTNNAKRLTISATGTADFSGGELVVSGTGNRTVRILGQGNGVVRIAGDGTTYATGIEFRNTDNGTINAGIYNYGESGVNQYMSLGTGGFSSTAMYIHNDNKITIGTPTNNLTDALQVAGSVMVTGKYTTNSSSGYTLLSGANELFSLGYSGGTLLNRFTGTSFFIAENGTPQLSIAAGGAATFSSSVSSDNGGNAYNFIAKSLNIGTIGNWVAYAYGYTGTTYQKAATFFESMDANGRGKFHIALNNQSNSTNVTLSDSKFNIDYTGAATFSSLSGSGNRIVYTNASGLLGSMVIGSGLSFDGTTLSATGGATGTVTGTGTSGTIALWNSASDIGNSIITQSGGTINVGGNLNVSATSGSDYGLTSIGTTGGSRKLLLVGQLGYSNGFTVEYDNSTPTMIYQMLNGSLTVGGSVIATSFSGAGTGLTGTASGLNIGGNAATATNSTQWNGNAYTGIESNTINAYIMAYTASGDWRPTTVAATRTWLGLGSNAYTSTPYLPLSGGTLTGALNGTSASFNSYAATYNAGAGLGSLGVGRWLTQPESSTITRTYFTGPDASTYGRWEIYRSTSTTPAIIHQYNTDGSQQMYGQLNGTSLSMSGGGSFGGVLDVVSATGTYSTFRTNDATSGNNAGGGFYNVASATPASRLAAIWLDADGANFSGSDYGIVEKIGNGGKVRIMNYNTSGIAFGTASTEYVTINGTNGLLSGTSLSMSGAGTFNGNLALNKTSGDALFLLNNPTGTTSYIRMDDNNTIRGYFGMNGLTGGSNADLTVYSNTGAVRIFSNSTNNLTVGTDGATLINGATPEAGYKLIVNGGVKGTIAVFDNGLGRLTIEGFAVRNILYSTTTSFGAYNSLRFQASDWSFHTGTGEVASISSTGAATFSSSVTASGEIKSTSTGLITAEYSDISTGENRGFKLNNTGSANGIWNITSGRTGVSNDEFVIRNAVTDINALVITPTTGAATFSSTIQATKASLVGATGETFTVSGVTGEWSQRITASSSTNNSFGLIVNGGTSTSDISFKVTSQSGLTDYLVTRGDGQTTARKMVVSGGSGELLSVNGVTGENAARITGSSSTSNSFGLLIAAGTNASDVALSVTNQDLSTTLFRVRGDGAITASSSVTAGSISTSGLLQTSNRLYVNSNLGISSWISSSLTAGYDVAGTNGWVNADGSLLLGTNGTARLTIASTGAATFSSSVTAGGDIYLGTRSVWLSSWLNQSVQTGANVTFNTVYASGNITAYSDIRLKTNIQSIQDPVQKLMMLNGFTYSRNDIADKSKRFIGLSAQDVISAGLTEAIEINEEGVYSVAYGNLAASLLVEVGKNHEERIQELESKLLAYENKFGKLN